MEREAFVDMIERSVLTALDSVMTQLSDPHDDEWEKGWVDADLNDLLPTIRKHAEKLYDRHEIGKKSPLSV